MFSLETPVKEPPRKKMRSENILEMDEEAQMGKMFNIFDILLCFSSVAAAIKASLAETLDGGEGDSSDGSDLETFTDDDNTNNSFEIKRKVPNGRYCWFSSNSAMTCYYPGTGGKCSPEKEKSESKRIPSAQDEDPSWESFLGVSEEKSNILIRWPDGSRDSWAQPVDTKVRSLLLFISSKVKISLERKKIK